MTRRILGPVAGLLVTLALAACGSEDERRLTAIESSQLLSGLEDVRERADEGDAAGARAVLRRVRERADALAGQGAFSPSERRSLTRGFQRIERTLDGGSDSRAPAPRKPLKTGDQRRDERAAPPLHPAPAPPASDDGEEGGDGDD